jgi:hypothetical protein
MGLDMYLHRRRDVANWSWLPPEAKREVTLTIGGKVVPLVNPQTIEEKVGYWRKANAIHKFFVDLAGGVDECQKIEVSNANLQKLFNLCNEVLATPELAPNKLPTESGFFFGSTEYDEWYIKGLKETVEILRPLLDPVPSFYADDVSYYYQASW